MDPLSPPLHQRLRPGHWVVIDCAATALMAVIYVVVWRDLAKIGDPRWLAATVLTVAVLPAAVRRQWPRTVLVLVVAGQAAATMLGAGSQPALAVAFVMYLIPLRLRGKEALWWLGGTLLAMVAGLLALAGRGHNGPPFHSATGVLLISGLLITITWLAGYAVCQQRAYATNLRQQTQRLAREELAEARRAVSEQRLGIAREIHDIVAHSMSLIAVQAGVANYVIGDNPQEASRALSSIEQTSREALHEMRALLGVLRTDAGTVATAGPARDLVPEPGLADLDSLIERTVHAGVRVDLDVHGRPAPLTAGLGLAAYRVIQEAITNVVKHAATDRCQVTITYRPETLTLDVTDGGTGHNGNDQTTDRLGIVGMRERVSMYGGQFHAGPLPGRGFQVTARFPLTESLV